MMSRVNAQNIYRSLINVLYVNKQEFSASSWRSDQGCKIIFVGRNCGNALVYLFA
jgi:hypothetical protein